ncbi:ScbR family autoregulator-binding transcription factor [Streptomyces sp. NPDC091268]|uniref:ScbR family autoregulator-binding transcription factor n=1 Tax=Streptomyces sp. NPDC091268 TaxID=3365979 RepID=UPI00382B98A4
MARARQERAELTRQSILDAAARAFDVTGFAGTSLGDVVRLAGVTKGALYFHFPSKEALARTLIDEQDQIFRVAPGTGEPGLQTLIDLTHRMAFGLRTNVRVRAGIRLVIELGFLTDPQATPYDGWIGTCHGCLARAQRRGDILSALDVYGLSTMLVGSFSGIQAASHMRTRRMDLHTRVLDLWNFLLPGIVPAHRISRFDPAGSPACRAELGLMALDSPPVPVG